MENNNCLIYFFVDNDGNIKINHLNNASEEIRESMGYRDGYPIVLFAYSYKDRKLFVTNKNEKELLKLLKLFKDSRESSISSSDNREEVRQLDVASEFLKSKYSWKGDIFPREDNPYSLEEKTIKDFNLVWGYISLIFGSMNLDPINVPVFVVDSLDRRSIFVGKGEVHDAPFKIHGPAIVVRRTNSMFFMCQSIIYQYVLNLHGIVDFSPKIEEIYLSDVKEFIDRTLISFLRNNDLKDRTFWYVGKKDGKLYLNRNDYNSDGDRIKSVDDLTFVITFEYAVIEDSRYIIINDISAGDVNISSIYSDMMNFIQDNLEHIGHIDNGGKKLENSPLYLFDGFSFPYQNVMATNLPIWIYIQTVLAPIYDFDPKDILILKGKFPNSFGFKYFDPKNKEDREYVSNFVNMDEYDEPLILWNSSSFDSLIGQWVQFSEEYMKFIDPSRISDNSDKHIARVLENFQSSVLRNPENRFAIESMIGLVCEENPHIHQYNVFNIFTKVIGLTGVITESMLEDSSELEDDEALRLLSDVQNSLFFLTIKTMANFCNIKHGTEFKLDGEIQKGDIVVDNKCQCIFEVKSVMLEPENQIDSNPDGITYKCLNLVCGSIEYLMKDEVKLFHLGFLDEEEYNEKVASKIKKRSQQSTEEFYKSMLERFLRNKKRSNPLDYIEDDDGDLPSFDSYLNKHRKNFNRSEGDAILENMLNDCRKVRSYGD